MNARPALGTIVAALALCLAAVACGGSRASTTRETSTTVSVPSAEPASPTQQPPVQPTTTVAAANTAASTTAPSNSVLLPPGSTFAGLSDATAEAVALLGAAVPAATIDDLGSAFRTALTARLLAGGCEVPPAMQLGFAVDDPAIPVLHVTAAFGCDDAVGGVRYTVVLGGDATTGWTVASATREDLCLRGTSGVLCV